jgi:hypothetical protein
LDLQGLSNNGNFSLVITWHGDEDKPFYKAMFVSPSRAKELESLPAFWSGAVIEADELQRAVAAIADGGVAWQDGAAPATARGYVVSVDEADRMRHAALGSRALQVLRAIETALAPAHRGPVRRILERAAGALAAEEPQA